MDGFTMCGPVSNREPWILAMLATDQTDGTLQDLSGCTFALTVKDAAGETVLTATTENEKFFVVPRASVIGWVFSADDMAQLSPGAYSAICEASKDGETK